MHQTLQINEILRLVFDLLADTGGKRALTNSTIVCQNFREPALDALWRQIFGLVPLLSILPTQVGGQTLVIKWYPSSLKQHLTFIRCLHQAKSAIMYGRGSIHAARVRVLITPEEQPPLPNTMPIHPSVYIRLAQVRSCILPQLKAMNVMKITPNTAAELMLCLSSTVRTLRIAPGNTDADWGDALYNVGFALDTLASHGSLNIEELFICINLTQSYVDKILPLQNLRILRVVDFVPPEAAAGLIQEISTLPKLEELHVVLLSDTVVNDFPDDSFPALRDLQLSYSSLNCVIRFLRAIPSGRVQSFQTEDPRKWENAETASQLREVLNEWRACFVALSRQSGLKDICIKINSEDVDEDILKEFQDIRFITLIEPLLKIKGMEGFFVSSFSEMPLSDEDVRKVVSAWPELTTLDFCYPNDVDQPSFLSLQHIATHCPHLESLAIAFDHYIDVPVPTSRAPSHPLKEIRLLSEDIGNEKVLMCHMKSLFPNLESILSSDYGEEHAIMDAYRSMEI